VKALSFWQPWASLVAHGMKTVETRAWPTHYRGPLIIHAALRTRGLDAAALQLLERLAREHLGQALADLPTGAHVGVADVVGCIPTDGFSPGPLERALGNYGPGRYAIVLAAALAFPSVPARGRQRFWTIDGDEERAVVEAMGAAGRAAARPAR
jgi:hypothetical protein